MKKMGLLLVVALGLMAANIGWKDLTPVVEFNGYTVKKFIDGNTTCYVMTFRDGLNQLRVESMSCTRNL